QTGRVFSFFAVLTVLFGAFFWSHGHADDVVVLVEIHAANSIGRTSHGTRILLLEANRHPLVRGQEYDLMSVSQAGGNQLIVLLNPNGDDAARHHIAEVFERRLLHRAIASDEQDI